jgi:hypothetical protein
VSTPDEPAGGSEGGTDCAGRSRGDPRSTTDRPTVLAAATVAVLALDAVLLAWTEMAWLTLRVGDAAVPVPIAALVAALTTPVLVLAADAAMPAGRALLVPLALWTLTILGAGLWSPAGGGVLPPDWRAILLLGAGVLPASLVVSWRSARRRGQQARRVTSPG